MRMDLDNSKDEKILREVSFNSWKNTACSRISNSQVILWDQK